MGSEKKFFVMFNDYPWESHLKKGRYYISMGLSTYCVVLFIGAASSMRSLRPSALIRQMTARIIKIREGLFTLEWPWWAMKIYRPSVMIKMMSRIRRYLVKRAVERLKGNENHEIVTYITHPSMMEYFNTYKKAIKIYNPYDKFSEFGIDAEINRKIEEIESEFVPKFDVVLCPHYQMVKFYKRFNTNTVLFPHGVDFEHYSKATRRETIVAVDIARIKRPIVGYAGVINERMDSDVLKYILKTRPDWSIVMIGPKRSDKRTEVMFDALMKFPNFSWLGYRDSDTLPNYLKNFDVGIIPYKVEKWVKWSSNPLKLHMYMAAGIPAVTCALDNIERTYDSTYVARELNEWIVKIQAALDENKEEGIKDIRLLQASNNDWNLRVNFLLEMLDNYNRKELSIC